MSRFSHLITSELFVFVSSLDVIKRGRHKNDILNGVIYFVTCNIMLTSIFSQSQHIATKVKYHLILLTLTIHLQLNLEACRRVEDIYFVFVLIATICRFYISISNVWLKFGRDSGMWHLVPWSGPRTRRVNSTSNP